MKIAPPHLATAVSAEAAVEQLKKPAQGPARRAGAAARGAAIGANRRAGDRRGARRHSTVIAGRSGAQRAWSERGIDPAATSAAGSLDQEPSQHQGRNRPSHDLSNLPFQPSPRVWARILPAKPFHDPGNAQDAAVAHASPLFIGHKLAGIDKNRKI
jgi:hypothetical protein